jgi:predicted RNA polymerase sigma factor
VPLASQDRSSWDQAAIARGVAALARTQHLGGDLGVFALQAAIASCHALAPTASDTDWGRIAALYDVLASRWPQPVVALNRAVAHAMLFGPATGLALLSPLAQEPALADYSPFHAVRGDLLERAGLRDEGAQAFLRAAATARTEREQVAFSARAQRLKSGG